MPDDDDDDKEYISKIYFCLKYYLLFVILIQI
jgi:hypothetical protein